MPTPASETGKLILDGVTIVGPLLVSLLETISGHPDATPEQKAAAVARRAAEMNAYRDEVAAARARIAGADADGSAPGEQ